MRITPPIGALNGNELLNLTEIIFRILIPQLKMIMRILKNSTARTILKWKKNFIYYASNMKNLDAKNGSSKRCTKDGD